MISISSRSMAGLAIAVASLAGLSFFAQDPAQVDIRTEAVQGNVHVLFGQGGNIGLSVGEDGVLMVDDQFAPLTPRILAAIGSLSEQPVHWVVNTHFHGDHTGGNENLAKAGATLVAHDNVRERLSNEQYSSFSNRATPPAPEQARPTVTFNDTMTLHWNGEAIEVIHVGPAHTDGDSIVFFKSSNVVHTGDTFFNGFYPYIDPNSGGRIDGMVRSADRLLEKIDEKTKIIPGHGPVGTKADLKRFRDVMSTISDRMQKLISAGKSRDEVIDAKPTSEFDEAWGQGFLTPDTFVGIVYDGLTAK
ncbi:MAG: MBL fold metallo-hydrolase [Planctomycetota bacterium]